MAAVERMEKGTFLTDGRSSTSFDEEENDISTSMARTAINSETDGQELESGEKNENDDGADSAVQEPTESHKSESVGSTQDSVGSDHSESEDSPKHPLHIVDTWDDITKRDRPLPKETLIHVMDHSMAMLGERLCEATNDNRFRESLKRFEHSLGRFRNSEIELGKRIASGSFADIYRVGSFRGGAWGEETPPGCTREQAKAARIVKQTKSDDYVVKVLKKNLLVNKSLFATGAADFITEGTLLASFDHPHILSIRGRSMSGVEGFSTGKRDCLFLVLERMDGDLTHKLQEWKRRTSQHGIFAKGRRNFNISMLCERLVLMSNVAAALAYLHERNVIHRDVALGNVGISFDGGKVKLLDFGLAKVLPPCMNGNERFLLTGNTGSIRYMAPEIGLKQPYNLRADVYSFTILLYEVLTLEKAFNNWQSNEIYERVHHKKFRPRMSMFWSQRIKELFRCCWSDNPDDRLPMNYVEAVLQKEARELETTMDSS